MSRLLTWDAVPLQGAITPTTLLPLRSVMYRGSNLVMPNARGRRPYEPTVDELEATIEWKIVGHLDPAGAPASNPQAQVELNVEYYRALFNEGGEPGTGLHPVILDFAGQQFTGHAQCFDWAAVDTGPVTISALSRLKVPAGSVSVGGS